MQSEMKISLNARRVLFQFTIFSNLRLNRRKIQIWLAAKQPGRGGLHPNMSLHTFHIPEWPLLRHHSIIQPELYSWNEKWKTYGYQISHVNLKPSKDGVKNINCKLKSKLLHLWRPTGFKVLQFYRAERDRFCHYDLLLKLFRIDLFVIIQHYLLLI